MTLVNVYRGLGLAPGAIELLYLLLKERNAEANISHSKMPSLEQQRQFVCRRPYRLWLMVEDEVRTRCGAIYATDRNEVGVFILKDHQRRGLAAQALAELFRTYQPLPAVPSIRQGRWLANINPANEASRALFASMGFTHIQNTYAL